MHDDIARDLASRYSLPLPVVRQVASEVAQRCALIANRYEPEGAFSFEQLSAVETLGAEIGSEILDHFQDRGPEQREPTAKEQGWGTGTGGPAR